jgi:hypothetical protein
MPAARRHRRHSKPPGRRRALELLADAGPAGCPAGTLAAHGYSADDLLALVREGLASPNGARPADMSCTYDLSRVTITEQGRAALAEAMAMASAVKEPVEKRIRRD